MSLEVSCPQSAICPAICIPPDFRQHQLCFLTTVHSDSGKLRRQSPIRYWERPFQLGLPMWGWRGQKGTQGVALFPRLPGSYSPPPSTSQHWSSLLCDPTHSFMSNSLLFLRQQVCFHFTQLREGENTVKNNELGCPTDLAWNFIFTAYCLKVII